MMMRHATTSSLLAVAFAFGFGCATDTDRGQPSAELKTFSVNGPTGQIPVEVEVTWQNDGHVAMVLAYVEDQPFEYSIEYKTFGPGEEVVRVVSADNGDSLRANVGVDGYQAELVQNGVSFAFSSDGAQPSIDFDDKATGTLLYMVEVWHLLRDEQLSLPSHNPAPGAEVAYTTAECAAAGVALGAAALYWSICGTTTRFCVPKYKWGVVDGQIVRKWDPCGGCDANPCDTCFSACIDQC